MKPIHGDPRAHKGIYADEPSYPIASLLRKLLWMRVVLFARALRRSSTVRRNTALVLIGIALVVCMVQTLLLLPSHTPIEPAHSSVTAAPATHVAAAVGAPAAAEGDNASYAADLRRRAAELHVEISRYNERENKEVKQRQLRKAAELLDNELAQLKEKQMKLQAPGRGGAPQPAARGGTPKLEGAANIASEPLTQALEASGCARARHPDFRIAMLLPWCASPSAASKLPAWLPFLIASAARSSLLVDWFIFHEGTLSAETLPRSLHASNVRFVDLHNGGLANLFGRTMAAEMRLPSVNATAIVNRMRFMFQKWPRLVAEYKPAYGSVFAEFLKNYTHWGYTDMDVITGQLPRFIERSELQDHHIVTYSFGDTEAVYLRGQWTIHRNIRQVNTIWLGCKHLARGLQYELFQKVAWTRRMEAQGKATYHKRFLSAEGCYSYRAAYSKGIKIKVANKQFVGLQGPAKEDVFVIGGAVWLCSKGRTPVSLSELRTASAPACDLQLRGVQRPISEPVPFKVTQEGCGNWMPPEFRMCATHLKGSQKHNLLLVDGQFYSQEYEESPAVSALGGRCKQGAFFHMQEWKKRWADGGVNNVDPKAQYDAFRLSADGIHAL